MPGMKVTVDVAMRVRDVSRPSPEHDSAAQASLADWPGPRPAPAAPVRRRKPGPGSGTAPRGTGAAPGTGTAPRGVPSRPDPEHPDGRPSRTQSGQVQPRDGARPHAPRIPGQRRAETEPPQAAARPGRGEYAGRAEAARDGPGERQPGSPRRKRVRRRRPRGQGS